jgi:hypothetical protein
MKTTRRNFMKGAMLGIAAATVPLSVVASSKPPHLTEEYWESLLPYQRWVVGLLIEGKNVRLHGPLRSGKSYLKEWVLRKGILPHGAHVIDFGRYVDFYQHEGGIDTDAIFQMEMSMLRTKGVLFRASEHVRGERLDYPLRRATVSYNWSPPSLHYDRPRIPRVRS